jgi:hypothetical protein
VASRWLQLFVALLVALAACGGPEERVETPAPTLGSSAEAEHQMRGIMRRWALGQDLDRQRLDRQLARFVQRFPNDDLVRLALTLRAWNALERGEIDRARALANGAGQPASLSPLLGPAGTTRDLATLVIGAADRRAGNSKSAVTRLAPLLHKMVDDYATALLDEELVQAAVGAKSWVPAVRYMEAWLREAVPGSERQVAERIQSMLGVVPSPELLEALRERAAETPGDESAPTVARLVAQELATRAVQSSDIELARVLVARYQALLGVQGDAVARLAVDTRSGRVEAGTVGLLVSLRSPALRRRSAEVMAGMAFGLGIPGSTARLVSRDGGDTVESVRRALGELAAEGAAVVVAGVDPGHSGPAAEYARKAALPVLLLTPQPDADDEPSPFVLLVGEDARRTSGLLAAELGKGAEHVAAFGEPTGDDRITPSFGCDPAPELAELKAAAIDGIVIRDGASCGPEVLALADDLRARVAVGLGAASLGAVPAGALRLGAGVFPVDVAHADPRLRSWLEAGRGAPGWWHALGRDSAVLAWQGVQHVLEAAGGDERAVRSRRIEATSALAAAEVELWTTAARGFGGSQRIERAVEVRGGGR